MSKKTRKQAGQEVWDGDAFLKSLLPQIPEDKREAVFEYLGEKALMRSDYDKSYAELKKLQEEAEQKASDADAFNGQANTWYAQNQQLLARALTYEQENPKLKEELQRLKTALGSGTPPSETPVAPPAPSLEGFLRKEEAEKLLQQSLSQIRQASWQDATAVATLSARHYKEFGEVLDPNQVLVHAQKVRKDLPSAYEDMFHSRYEEKRTQAEEARLKKLEQEIEERVRAKYAQSPYPIPDATDPGGSALSGLGNKDGEFTVAAALRDLANMRQGQR